MQTQPSSRGPIDPSQWQKALTPHEFDTGATRAEPSQGRRFQPYPNPRVCRTEHIDTEADPPTNDNPNPYPVLSLASATGALATQTNTLANLRGTIEENYWDMAEQPGSMAGPPYVQDSYGKHHGHRLVDWCLTRGLQIR